MRTLGVIAPFLEGLYSGAIISALYRLARQDGLSFLIVRAGSQVHRYDLPISIECADAWICIIDPAAPELLQKIHASGRPVCVIAHDYGLPEVGLVRIDNCAGIQAAMTRLYAAGHRRFAFLGSPDMDDSVERWRAARDFVASHPECAELAFQPTRDFSSFAGGREAAARLIDSGASFSALIAASDQVAFGAITLLRERGIRVPEDVAVTGFDNAVISRTQGFGITTLDQNLPMLAALAYQDVRARVLDPGDPPVRGRGQPELIERESTGQIPKPSLCEMIERGEAQDYLVASEEVSLASLGGRESYLQSYFTRLQFRLAFACVARLLPEDRLLPLSVMPASFQGGAIAVGEAVSAARFPLPCSAEAGDLAVVLIQEGLPQGLEAIALGLRASDLASTLALETLVHEVELLYYQLQAQAMSDELRSTLVSLRQTQDELLRYEKHAALGVAIAGIAHEMNTPLGNSLLAASTLKEQIRDVRPKFEQGSLRRSDIEKFIAGVEQAEALLSRNIGKALNLVRDFKLIRGEQLSSELEAMALAPFIAELVEVLRVRCAKLGVTIDAEVEDGLMLKTNPHLLGQVLSELVENALAHGLVGRQGGWIRITGHACEGRHRITVTDSGVGIPPGASSRVFDPFFTTRMGVASGLGLTMVHNLVSGALAGKVWVESPGEGGARFVIELP